MAGELSNSGVGPALANAVFDAAGVRLFAFPITAERIHEELSA
jgi:CO/xanthine dehydrogenase Mo-binding subunit